MGCCVGFCVVSGGPTVPTCDNVLIVIGTDLHVRQYKARSVIGLSSLCGFWSGCFCCSEGEIVRFYILFLLVVCTSIHTLVIVRGGVFGPELY